MLLASKISKYLEAKKPTWSLDTYYSTKSRLKHYSGQKPGELYESLINGGYNPYYIKTVFINISKFLGWGREQGRSTISNAYKEYMQENPQLFRNVYEDKYTTLTKEEFLAEYNQADGEIKRALALLGFAGCRISELSTFDGTTVIGKGRKRRRVYLPFDMDKAPVTLNEFYIRRRLKRKPHEYRKLAADTWLKGGADIKTVQVLLGHSSILSTQRYLRPSEESETQKFMEKLYA